MYMKEITRSSILVRRESPSLRGSPSFLPVFPEGELKEFDTRVRVRFTRAQFGKHPWLPDHVKNYYFYLYVTTYNIHVLSLNLAIIWRSGGATFPRKERSTKLQRKLYTEMSGFGEHGCVDVTSLGANPGILWRDVGIMPRPTLLCVCHGVYWISGPGPGRKNSVWKHKCCQISTDKRGILSRGSVQFFFHFSRNLIHDVI